MLVILADNSFTDILPLILIVTRIRIISTVTGIWGSISVSFVGPYYNHRHIHNNVQHTSLQLKTGWFFYFVIILSWRLQQCRNIRNTKQKIKIHLHIYINKALCFFVCLNALISGTTGSNKNKLDSPFIEEGLMLYNITLWPIGAEQWVKPWGTASCKYISKRLATKGGKSNSQHSLTVRVNQV